MTTPDLRALYENSDALALAAHVRAGDVSPLELAETAIALIEERNPAINAVVIKTYEIGRKAAMAQPSGHFAGVPFLLKNIGSMWKGAPLTNGFPHMQDFVCDYDSQMSRRIRDAGFLMLGRTNAPEGGWSLGTEPRLYGATRNPWNADITPGGSSGGAAAAVAAGMVPLAEASDGGGSIRGPSSCCGLVGLKPSRGRITYGPQVPEAWLGSIATFCVSRTVRDTAAFLDVVAGSLPGDAYVAPSPVGSWLEASGRAPGRLRIGFTRMPAWNERLAPDVVVVLDETLKRLASFGHDLEEHDPGLDLRNIWFAYNKLNAVEAAADFDRFERLQGRTIHDDELAPVYAALRRRGLQTSAVEHTGTIASLRLASHRIASEIDAFDVFVTPTLTQLPRPLGYWSMEEPDLDAYLDRWSDAGYLFCFNIAGLPAISLPVATTGANIPVGLQFVARHGDEGVLLALAQQLEDDLRWHLRRP